MCEGYDNSVFPLSSGPLPLGTVKFCDCSAFDIECKMFYELHRYLLVLNMYYLLIVSIYGRVFIDKNENFTTDSKYKLSLFCVALRCLWYVIYHEYLDIIIQHFYIII